MDIICLKIEQLRKDKGLSQTDLSDKIGISLATYTNLIRTCDFRISHLKKMSEVLLVPINYFFEDLNNENITIEGYKSKINKLEKENKDLKILSDYHYEQICDVAKLYEAILEPLAEEMEEGITYLQLDNDNPSKFVAQVNKSIFQDIISIKTNLKKGFKELDSANIIQKISNFLKG